MEEGGDANTVILNLLGGELMLDSLILNGFGQTAFPGGKVFRAGQPVKVKVDPS